MSHVRAARLLLVWIVLTPGLAWSARTNSLTGRVTGQATDSTGAGVSDVLVRFINTTNGHVWTGRTTMTGKFVILQIEAGAYRLTAEKSGFAPFATPRDRPLRLLFNYPEEVIPPIRLRSAGVAGLSLGALASSDVSAIAAAARRQTPAPTTVTEERATSLVSLQDWALRSNVPASVITALPLRDGRTFDQLALFAPGVARANFSADAGPAAGIGVGSTGLFAVNGMRSRSNNFTVDGSDNNDEDLNVRRQGFVALTPQSPESLAEFQIMTAGFPAEFGRNAGSMVNAISRSGTNTFAGAAYGLFGGDLLNASEAFDTPFQDTLNVGNLNGGRYSGKDSTNAQYGFAVGGAAAIDRLFYFVSGERQRGHGEKLRHFITPAPSERGLRVNKSVVPAGFVPIEELQKFLGEPERYSAAAGVGVFSLYPRPNNPRGPFGERNYSQTQRFVANSDAASLRLDWKGFERHAASGRYSFTQDHSRIPFTGDAINSAIGARTRTQNLSLFLNSTGTRFANALRLSYGRTRLSFPPEEASPLLFGSSDVGAPAEFVRTVDVTYGHFGPFGVTGPIGQLAILPFSPIGVDVYNFPQGRVDNTYQFSDFVTRVFNRHIAKAGFDIRYSQLNSFMHRNERPLVVFGYGNIGGSCLENALCPYATEDRVLHGTDTAALGAPSGFLQSLNTTGDDRPGIGLRIRQFEFFAQDDWNVRPRLTLNFGLRYEVQTVPREVNGRIEDTLDLNPQEFEKLTPTGPFADIIAAGNEAFDEAVVGLQQFLGGRRHIYDSDRNNVAPKIGVAWNPLNDGGRTAIRGGFGMVFDTNPGAFTSQSRNVFPSFVPVNLDLNFDPPRGTRLNSPTFYDFVPTGTSLIKPGTLNTYNLSGNEFATGLGILLNQQPASPGGSLSSNGLAFTLPERKLKTAWAQHWVVTAERQFGSNWLVSASYVGTRGRNLPRLTSPNGGLISRPLLLSSPVLPLTIRDLPPSGRAFPSLGAITVLANSATSDYHAMQITTTRRFGGSFDFRSTWTWSHAIDEVSDIFDSQGAFALPQDGSNLRRERASANFDARLRWATYTVWRGSGKLQHWTIAAIGEIQSGPPYTVNSVVDLNGDGNLTDRPDGVGRNAARAAAMRTIDAAVTREFLLAGAKALELRVETFNLMNWENRGLPSRVIESPGFGISSTSTVASRSFRLAAKLRF